MSITLYWGSGSPVSWRVQVALALKGVEVASHRLDLSSREHRTPAYLALNPKGTFPLLVDGDVIIRESLAILAYLDRKFPAPALFGETPRRYAMTWQGVLEHDAGMAARVDAVTRAVFRDRPPDDLTSAREALDALAVDLRDLDAVLANTVWLGGREPSALDVVHYPTVHRLLRASKKPRFADLAGERMATPLAHCPALAGWLAAMAGCPGVDETYPPHWR